MRIDCEEQSSFSADHQAWPVQGHHLLTTPALPFYRICYRVVGKRLQRIRKVIKEAEKEAHAILDKLDSGDVSIANIITGDMALLHTAKRELAGCDVRLDIATYEICPSGQKAWRYSARGSHQILPQMQSKKVESHYGCRVAGRVSADKE